jgi:hypothetical protein
VNGLPVVVALLYIPAAVCSHQQGKRDTVLHQSNKICCKIDHHSHHALIQKLLVQTNEKCWLSAPKDGVILFL